MNTFNESNTIEAMLIEAAQKAGWDYVPIADVPRNESQILVEPWLVEALRRLNPALTPAQIDEVVIKLRTVCVAATRDELVTANQRFRKLLFEENSYPFGEDGMHVNVRFFDEEHPENNRCVITNQWEFPRRSAQGGKRYDIVMVVNGIPMVICETKTPVRPSETWANAAQDMVWYQGCTPEMFVPNARGRGSGTSRVRMGISRAWRGISVTWSIRSVSSTSTATIRSSRQSMTAR